MYVPFRAVVRTTARQVLGLPPGDPDLEDRSLKLTREQWDIVQEAVRDHPEIESYFKEVTLRDHEFGGCVEDVIAGIEGP